jgi:hypothetical protein
MNRRTFFAATVGALSLPALLASRLPAPAPGIHPRGHASKGKRSEGLCGEESAHTPPISKIRERQREAEIRSILRLKDEISAGVRKATRELKKLNQKLNHDPMRWSSGWRVKRF